MFLLYEGNTNKLYSAIVQLGVVERAQPEPITTDLPSITVNNTEIAQPHISIPDNNFGNCETIHVAFVVDNTRHLAILLKSIFFYRHSPLHFHFLANKTDHVVLEKLLDSWQIPSVSYNFYPLESLTRTVPRFAKNNSNIFNRMKLMLPSILPPSVKKVISLDTNLVVAIDIKELWVLFSAMKTEGKTFTAIQTSFSCLNSQTLFDLKKCFKTSVMLFDLRAMREQYVFFKLWDNIVHSGDMLTTCKSWSTVLSCGWNVDLNKDLNCSQWYRIIQYESMYQLLSNISSSSNLNFLNKLIEYDNYLLKYLPGKTEDERLHPNLKGLTKFEVCNDFKDQEQKTFITHLFFYGNQYISVDEYDVTLVTQMTVNRIQTLHTLLKHWNGPASIAVYGTESDIRSFIQYVNKFGMLEGRSNVAIHIVYIRKGYYHPINYLRNVAWSAARSPYVFLIDLDFIPSYGLYHYLRKATELLMTETQKRALVVAAFETKHTHTAFPNNKAEMVKLAKGRIAVRFHEDFSGHTATDYSKWMTASYPYIVTWSKNYEPYMVVRTSSTRYDNRYIGVSLNKISHTTELHAQGYEFVVLPDGFIFHYPHSKAHDRIVVSHTFRSCVHQMSDINFMDELKSKYGKDCLKKGEADKRKDIIIKIVY